MKIYSANGNGKFVPEIVEMEDERQIKVKVSYILPTPFDVNIFSGRYIGSGPFVVGRKAIGVVSEDYDEYGLKQGQKIILNPYDERMSDKSGEIVSVSTRGIDQPGFFADFLRISPERIIPFPEGLDDKHAIFTVDVAVALRALSVFEQNKGRYVVILGSDAQCCIMAQIAMYFQMIPILIGTCEKRLAFAKQKGVYYILDATKEVPLDRVREITGGRMADFAVMPISKDTPPSFAFSLVRDGGRCVIIGEDKRVRALETDIGIIGKRQLRVEGIDNGAEEMQSAVNLLVQKAIDLDGFIDYICPLKDAEVCFREMDENIYRYYAPIISMM